MWVFDLRGKCMRWANPAGLAFWNATSLEEFLARDFANLSLSAVIRNQSQMDEHAAGRHGRDQWTVYPKGQPTTLNAHTIAVELPEGGRAILYEATQVSTPLDPSVLRGVEAMQQTPLIVAMYRMSDGSVVMRNPAGQHSFGIVDTSVRRDDFAAMFADQTQVEAVLLSVSSQQIYIAEAELITLHGRRWHLLDVRPVLDPVTGESMLQLNAQDITDSRYAAQLERFRSATMELIVANKPLNSLLETIVLGVEDIHPGMLCSILLLGPDGRHLCRGAAPSLPEFYNAAIEQVQIGIGVGSCGTAAVTGERVVVSDITTHPYWIPYRELAASAGLASCWSQPIRGVGGKVLGTFAMYWRAPHEPAQPDIDIIEQSANLASIAIERQQALARLQLAASVFGHAREGISITDVHGTIVDVNESFTRITGYSREEVIGKNPRILSSGRQDPAFYTAMWAALIEQGHWSGEVWNRRKNGEIIAELLTISAVRDAQGQTQQYVALFSDITSIKAHQSQLEHIAHFDALTHLPNRLLLADRLRQAMAQALRRSQHLAVAYLDLDGFKSINDNHGHNVGDQVLVTLAQRMKIALREGDSLARLGGDEFAAVLIDLEGASSCLPLLTRLLNAAAHPVQIGELTLQASASIGVTFFPQRQDIDADQLLRQADQAMYQAKLAGKNRFQIFDTEQDSSVRGHHESLERIRLAVEQHEFVLIYQPKVNMRTGQVIGAEALIRWQHPEKGLLVPDKFLPAIEDHPLAVTIGEWVIDAALTQMELWRTGGFSIPVSVNVGARQLQQSDFVDRLRGILLSHPSLSQGCLELEVLETSALEDIGQVSEVIESCAQMGVTFALDDFGTGYSSLTYLKRLRVNLLKIDKSFVCDMLVDPDDLAILRGVIGLAAAFRHAVIAEGVETQAHGRLLLELGCELAQGFGIARPMPATQLPAWAVAWQEDPVWVDGN